MVEQSTAMHNLGTIMFELAKKGCLVRMGYESSMLGSETIVLHASTMNSGNSVSLKEAISLDQFEAIRDPHVIVAAIHERLKKAKKP